MNPELPPAFYGSFVGAVLSGGLVLFWLARLLSRVSFRRRLAALASDERGTTLVEFPFVLIVLIQLTLWTWQLVFICTATLVVDYAAYTTARCAIVTIPKDWGKSEPAGTILTKEPSGPTGFGSVAELKESLKTKVLTNKRRDLRWAAAFVCYPISGYKTLGGTPIGGASFGGSDFGASATLQWPAAVDKFLLNHEFVSRFLYTGAYTSVDIDPAPGVKSGRYVYDAGASVSVLVTHHFSLRVPFASALFRAGTHPSPDGDDYMSVTGRATMLIEEGNEATPPSPPTPGDKP